MSRPGGSGSSTSGYTWKFVLKEGESEDTAPMLYANIRGEIFFNPNCPVVPCLHALVRKTDSSADSSGAGPSQPKQPVRRMLTIACDMWHAL